MKPTIALLALCSVGCGGSSGGSSAVPTAPTATAPTLPPAQVDGGQLVTYQNAVAYLPAGIGQYQAAIVFLPGLRDPATGKDLDSRALVRGTSDGARVAGFLTMKGGCHNLGPAAAAAVVPGYFLIGALDEQYRRDNIMAVFEGGRAAGAPWAVSIDPFQHGPMVDFDRMFDWSDAVLAARLRLT